MRTQASSTTVARLLLRVQLLVHHGGIGTIVEALWTGVQQCIVLTPRDQPASAERLKALWAVTHPN